MISWRDGGGVLHAGSLFGAFAALARGEAWSFPALRPHQREPWHAFTCQVAALALIRMGRTDLPPDEAAWRELLLALTPDQPTAWELVVDDWTQPALLQPPVVSEANRGDYKNLLPTPDALDMLATAKNHDVKAERIGEADAETWLFALITLQTGEGYGGAGNFGVSRMNGGLSNRMSLSLRPSSGGAAAAFGRDVARLVADAQARSDRRGGVALLWTKAWDGTTALDFTKLDELYVEICRRVRLRSGPAGIEALATTSKVSRVAAKELLGRTGDPWAPMKADGSASVTAAGNGFGYRAMAKLLRAADTTPPLLAKLNADDPAEIAIVASALVRGQGKTEGLHRRAIRTTGFDELDDPLDRMGEVATRRAADASEAGRRLRRALISLVQGGPDQARLDDDAAKKKTDPWMDGFDRDVDAAFFDDAFWQEASHAEAPHKREWRERLRGWAGETLAVAAEAAPRTQMRRVRAIARARSLLDASMTKWIREVPDGE